MTTATNVTVSTPDPEEPCHGCTGKGWIEVQAKPFKCVVCDGSGKKPVSFHQYPPITVQPNPWVSPWPNYPSWPHYLYTPCQWCGKTGCNEMHIIYGAGTQVIGGAMGAVTYTSGTSNISVTSKDHRC